MDKPAAELSRAWLRKAHSDLHTARQIGGLPDGHLDAGIYHCQQAAEKSLKGFLIFHGSPFEKVHDLGKSSSRPFASIPRSGSTRMPPMLSRLIPLPTAILTNKVFLIRPAKNLMKLCDTPKPFTISSSSCFRQKRDRERQRNGTTIAWTERAGRERVMNVNGNGSVP
jgi:hypothetical protein